MLDIIVNFLSPYVSVLEPYAAIYGAVVALCTAIVKATPSKKDDTVWGNIVKVLDFFSTAFTDSDKKKLEKK